MVGHGLSGKSPRRGAGWRPGKLHSAAVARRIRDKDLEGVGQVTVPLTEVVVRQVHDFPNEKHLAQR